MASASTSSMLLPMSESNKTPMGCLPPNNCMAALCQIEAVQAPGGVTERVNLHFHAIHHGHEQVRHRRFLAVHDAPARLEELAAAPGDERGQIFVRVAVAVCEACAVDDHRVLEDVRVRFLDRLELQ